MSKTTKYFALYSAIKAGGDKGSSPDSLCKSLGFSHSMLAVYIHALRNKFGAEIESVRNGKRVVTYRVTNIAECDKNISPNRKPRTTNKAKATKVARVTKTVKSKPRKVRVERTVEELLPVIEDMSITEIGSEDLADIKSQLGIA
jgi:biotin operon repressor